MTHWLAQSIVAIIGLYASAGLLFALWFVTAGLARVDKSARDASWGLRLLLLPGSEWSVNSLALFARSRIRRCWWSVTTNWINTC